MKIKNNSEILFIYDAKMTNPNGDMDNENKPRMDYDTNTNLVSDVRLKRYIRDYYETVDNKEIFITSGAKDAKDRALQMRSNNIDYTDLIDIKLFGGVYAAEGGNDHLTGPVQFNWGYSLNPVEITDSSTITSSFSGGEGIGKDYRVKYSLLAFSGSVNSSVAEYSTLQEEELTHFDEVVIKSLFQARTRSKIGQTPRLYMRVEMKDKSFLKDLREYISLTYNVDKEFLVRSISDIELNLDKLIEYLKANKEAIHKVKIWIDDQINLSHNLEQIKSIGIEIDNFTV